jgi:hypothetical protein
MKYPAYAKQAGISSLRKTRWKIHLTQNTLEYPAYEKTRWNIQPTQNTLEYPAYANTLEYPAYTKHVGKCILSKTLWNI